MHQEKIGKYKFSDLTYQQNRKTFQLYAQQSVNFNMGCLVGHLPLIKQSYKHLKEKISVFTNIQKHILREYEQGVFSSRHITRPEASHPLVIAAACHHYTWGTKDGCDTIIGLPAGSTELALAHSTSQKIQHNRDCKVLLLPISLHSGKNEFDQYDGLEETTKNVNRWVANHKKRISAKDVLVVDDNSSTGRTIELAASKIRTQFPRSLNFAVAEADIIRSKLDLHNPNRKHVASVELYKHSINILPVLQRKHKKKDLKEIIEKKMTIKCTENRYLDNPDKKHKLIIGNVYVSMIKEPNPTYYDNNDASISNFKGTFLSNFQKVPIEYEDKKYFSVEHAYQAMKFEKDVFKNLKQKHIDIINRKLADRGVEIKKDNLATLFTDPNLTAGTSKITANQLRIMGFARADWDFVKAPIMLDLLLQKFSNTELYDKLRNTNGFWLVEGNDWHDTYWGVCGGRGRNVLGRMLMEIRASNLDLITELAQKKHLSRSVQTYKNIS